MTLTALSDRKRRTRLQGTALNSMRRLPAYRVQIYLSRTLLVVVMLVLLTLHPILAQDNGTSSVPSGQTSSPQEIKARLNHILSQPDFSTPGHSESLLGTYLRKFIDWFHHTRDRISDWFHKVVEWFWKKLQFGGDSAPFGAFILWVFITVFAIGMIYLLSRFIRYQVTAYRTRKAANDETILATDEELNEPTSRRSPDAWISEATRFASEEDYRRAIRALFLAVLLELDQSGIQEYDRSLTNGDYLALLRNHGFARMAGAFDPFVITFEDRWYGEQTATRPDYEKCLNAYRALSALIESRADDRRHLQAESTEAMQGVAVAN